MNGCVFIGRAPLYPVGVRGARCHGQPGGWAGERGSPGSLGKRGARELERASSQSYSARNCDIHPVLCRYPAARQPHSHRFCASTGDRKSSHQAAPIVCSQFALLSPDSATSTSQQSLAPYLRQQCLHVEKDAVSTEAEAMPAAVFAAVDAAATVEATATLGITADVVVDVGHGLWYVARKDLRWLCCVACRRMLHV